MKNYVLNEGYKNTNYLGVSGKGSKIKIKKNNYLDLSLCAGSLLLGHNSKIFKQSIKNILKKNISNIAGKNLHALKFANTLKKIYPKYSKFIFCNSGTEAVIKSLRIARSITNKNIIISVTGSWHGSTSELLFTNDENLNNIELSSGLNSHYKKQIKFIPYNDVELSKKILNTYKKKIMCIILEPIQGCLPINAENYLKFLDAYAKKNNIILIFDEIITGLRVDCSSVQDKLNLNPLISTFGKCFGGGLPIGIIAIKKKIVNKLNKKKKKVFFGGTFSGNSIVTYIANKITKFIIKEKKIIFSDLNKKALYLQSELNNFFRKNKLDANCLRYSSMLRIIFSKEIIKNRIQRDFFEHKNKVVIEKFKNFLLKKNIYYSNSGLIFIATSTSFKEIDYLIGIIKKAFKKLIINNSGH